MAQFVSNVREPGLAGSYALGPRHGLVHGGMARMRFVTQRRKNDCVQSFEQRKARIRNGAHIREICSAAKAKSCDLHLAMQHRHASEIDAMYAGAVAERLDVNPCTVGISGLREKTCSRKCGEALLPSVRDAYKRNVTAFAKDSEAQRSKIIKTEDMIGVPMRIEDSVHASQTDCAKPARESLVRYR